MDDDKLDTRRARYFMQVVECGSVRGAAELLDMDPSAVSRAVAVLEKDCGTRLLERRGRGVVATEAGRLLGDFLRRRLAQQQHLLAELDSIEKAERGHVDIVAGEGFIDWLMRGSLREFMAAHPRITVDIDVGGTDEIVKRIVEDRAHIGLVFQPPQDERLRSHGSQPYPIVAIVAAAHPLARIARALELADLLPYPGAALHRGYGVRQHVEAAETSEGVRLDVRLTASSFNAVGQFAAAGLGYVLTPAASLPPRLDAGQLVALPMKNPLLHRGRSHLVTRQGRWLCPAAAELLSRIAAAMARGASTRSAVAAPQP